MDRKQKRILIVSLTIMLLLSISVIIFVVVWLQRTAEGSTASTMETSLTETAAAPSDAAAVKTEPVTVETEPVTVETQTEAVTEQMIVASDELLQILAKNGNTAEQIADLGCRQLVTVEGNGSNAQIGFYQLVNNEWVKDDSLACNGYVGANGITENMHEGGYATPKGLYSISDAFYIDEAPVTGLSSFRITNDTYWIDDPDSAYYNQHIEGTANKDWNSAEHMLDYATAYEYGFVIDYNTEAVYNAGSAIFFHVSYRPTAGCVGADKENVLQYLSKLDESMNPYIVIV